MLISLSFIYTARNIFSANIFVFILLMTSILNSITFLTFGISSVIIGTSLYRYINIDTQIVSKEAIEIKEYDKLSIPAILKKNDLKTYFLKQQEYYFITENFRNLKHDTSNIAMIQVLNNLRENPFFDYNNNYRLEYNTLLLLLTQNNDDIYCNSVEQMFPEYSKNIQKIYVQCTTKNSIITKTNAINALIIKLL